MEHDEATAAHPVDHLAFRRSSWTRRATISLAFAAMATVALPACDKKNEEATQKAVLVVESLSKTVATDVDQMRKGMPEAAGKLAGLLPEDPPNVPDELRIALTKARDQSDNLRFAKGTFFSFALPDGRVIRSEGDPDRLADANVFKAFPELKKSLEPGAGLVEATGEMQEIRGVKKGPDIQWIIAHGVGDKAKETGVYVSGWSYRAYTEYLLNQAKQVLKDDAEKSGETAPLLYVFVVKGGTAYGSMQAPEVNAEALQGLDIIGKLDGDATWTGTVEITKRSFSVAAKRVSGLGEDVAVAALTSSY